MDEKEEMEDEALNSNGPLSADADVVFTRERCDRTKFGLQALRGEPSRYRQCGPNGRVWIVPCVPGAVFDPLHKVSGFFVPHPLHYKFRASTAHAHTSAFC